MSLILLIQINVLCYLIVLLGSLRYYRKHYKSYKKCQRFTDSPVYHKVIENLSKTDTSEIKRSVKGSDYFKIVRKGE